MAAKDIQDFVVDAYLLKDTEGSVIPTTLSMDIALSGGIVEGSITQLVSPPKSGKTTLCLETIAKAQRLYKKQCYYFDVESRLRTELLECIDGLVWTPEESKRTGIPMLKVIRSTEGNFLNAQDYLNFLNDLILNEPGIFAVVDSVAALCTEELQAAKLGESVQMGGVPKLMYNFLRKIAQVLPVMKSTLIMITHQQKSMNAYSGPTAVGGEGLRYFASNILVSYGAGVEVPTDGGKDVPKIGKNTTFKVMASSLGGPSREGIIYIRYGKGCDSIEDLLAVAKDYGYIQSKGAWYYYNENKYHGKEELYNFFKDNPELKIQLENTIRKDLLGKKYVEISNIKP